MEFWDPEKSKKLYNEKLGERFEQSYYVNLPLNEWRSLLSKEVDVYVYNTSYIAKRFDSISYEFCELKEAEEICKDNLYALLRFKYFLMLDNDIDKLIEKIVNDFIKNLKTTLIKISFEWEGLNTNLIIKDIPIYCVAFRNGVYNFKDNKWLFEIYDISLSSIENHFYKYNSNYIILWFVDIYFEPYKDLNLLNISNEQVVNYFTKSNTTLASKLIYNMSFDEHSKFSLSKFEHLCQILGYTISPQFIQNFIIFIGTGSNGKNSLFDGCLSSHLVPKPASISLDDIEEDKFVTGSLNNRFHNFYLEADGKTYHKSKVLKQLTGSTQQSIERKGETVRTGYLNVKYIFSANQKDKIKFGDDSVGFIRRINLYEVFYQWDSRNRYLKEGKFFEVNFSPDLRELKYDINNTITYIYLAMWGILTATKKFTKSFDFKYNDYSTKYENINSKTKSFITQMTIEDIIKIILQDELGAFLYVDDVRIYLHKNFNKFFNLKKESNWRNCVNNVNDLIEFLEDKDVYINLNMLKELYAIDPRQTQQTFNNEIKKFSKKEFKKYYNNQNYCEIKIIDHRIKFN